MLPHSLQQRKVRITGDSQSKQVIERLSGTRSGYDFVPLQSTQNLGHFNIHQLWSMQRFVSRIDSLFDTQARRG